MDLPLRATGWASEGEFPEPGRILEVIDVLQRKTECPHQRFWSFRGFGMKNLKGKEGIMERVGKREGEALVPDGSG